MSAIVDLQNAVNRFAGVSSFAALPIDGNMSAALGTDAINAIQWVGINLGQLGTTVQLMASLSNADGSPNLVQITTSAAGIAIFLNQNADTAKLPATPLSISSVTGLTTGQAGMLGIGGAAVLAVLYLISRRKHSSGVSGYRRRR